MPKRDTVFINYKKTVQLIKEKYRNNTIFCEAINKAMGTERTTKWVSEWKRNSNLPSPQEAVYICVLLQTTPDEILLHQGETAEETAKCQEDIALVRELLEQMQGAKKAPDPEIEGGSQAKKALMDALDDLTDEQCEKLLPIILSAKRLL